MSWLLFERKAKKISLYEGTPLAVPHLFVGPSLGRWDAHNETASNSKGAWPDGIYRWSHYNAHSEAGFAPGCYTAPYGCQGIHVFSVPGRVGMGVHSGRTFGQPGVVGKVTLGCIRVPSDAMSTLNQMHIRDPLHTIEIM